jgi:hypothetical protein
VDLEYIEDKIDVFIENSIKEKKLRRKINYAKILCKRANISVNVHLDGNSNNTNK